MVTARKTREAVIAQREPTAAQALYPHLRQGTPEPVNQRRIPNSVADAMYPRTQPEPEPRDWRDVMWQAGGLRRKGK
jgi:hypothetical protein